MVDFLELIAAIFIAFFALVTVGLFLTPVGWVIIILVLVKLLFY